MRHLLVLVALFWLACVPPRPCGINFYGTVHAVRLPAAIAMGSAVIVRSDAGHTIVATALHVIDGADYIRVTINKKQYEATPLVYNRFADVVLLRINASLPAPEIIDTLPRRGTPAYAIGPSPFGPVVLNGNIASEESYCPTGRGACAITSIPSGPGFSGAPVFTQENELVGIILGYSTRPPTMTFFTTSSQLKALLFSLDTLALAR